MYLRELVTDLPYLVLYTCASSILQEHLLADIDVDDAADERHAQVEGHLCM